MSWEGPPALNPVQDDVTDPVSKHELQGLRKAHKSWIESWTVEQFKE